MLRCTKHVTEVCRQIENVLKLKVKEGTDSGSVSVRCSSDRANEEKCIEDVTDKNFIHP
jgi:hypothetical protein